MDGLNIKNMQRILENQGVGDSKSINVSNTQRRNMMDEMKTNPSDVATGTFADTLTSAIGKVNQMQVDANKGIENLATGRTDNIAEVMTQTEKADIALKLMMQVRNKILDAYQEIMRMQV